MPSLSTLAQRHAVGGDPRRGLATFQRLYRSSPNDPGVWHGIGMCYFLDRRFDLAELWLSRAARVGGVPAWHTNYGNQLEVTGRDALAVEQFERSLALEPNGYPALMGMSKALHKLGDFERSREYAIRAMAAEPGSDDAAVHAAQALVQSGDVPGGLELLRRGLAAMPNSRGLRTMLAGSLVYDETASALDVRRAAEAAWREFPRTSMPRLDNGRWAILSPDLRRHSVGYFAKALFGEGKPWLKVYHTSDREDDYTAWFRARADDWASVSALSESELRKRIIADRIDVLIELSGYSYGNRLAALAERCAPVQVTYLGWPATTGVPNIDYRIVDAVTDVDDSHCTERLIRVPGCFVSYTPPDEVPEVKRCTEPVFGSFNAIPKLSDRTWALWRRVVEAVPGSRLVVKARGADGLETQGRLRERSGLGFALSLLPHTPTTADHLAAYNGINVALDPLGYNGTTTTCEALLMGVPVVTMTGDRHASRVGTSLGAIVARDEDEYVARAVAALGTRAELLRASRWGEGWWESVMSVCGR